LFLDDSATSSVLRFMSCMAMESLGLVTWHSVLGVH
jgi:hypothetical protein